MADEQQVPKQTTVGELVAIADEVLALNAAQGLPPQASFIRNCPCGNAECGRKFVIHVHELHASLFSLDAMRSIH